MTSRIGIDIGGTFTDLVFYENETGMTLVEKVPTTPSHPEQGCIHAIATTLGDEQVFESGHFLHGTTVGLNALLERRGAVVGLLTTTGFRDVLELRRGSRDEVYNLFASPPQPLVPRHLRLPVNERVRADGEVIKPLQAQDIVTALESFNNKGVTSIAVSFMNAYANPSHELEAERLLRKAGFTGEISLSHRVSGEYRDYERTSTTVIDAFVRARMSNYLEFIKDSLHERGFAGESYITRSGGGSMTFQEAAERPFETIMSGPVAGVEGASELARDQELGDLVTADVGGTSFDTCLITGGRPHLLYQGTIDGMPVQTPWIDVRSIGAGGGSIAHVDVGGLMQVGPQSAGAEPGPVCYGRGGTTATVTDAAFFLGMLGEGQLASGVSLNHEAAAKALAVLARELDIGIEETACGIIAIAGASMAAAIRELTLERGIDARDLSLLAFGGAGPMMATQLARELSIDTIIVPQHAGNFSAWGLLGADLLRATAKTQIVNLSEQGLQQVNDILAELFEKLDTNEAETVTRQKSERQVALDMRYRGQEHTLTLSPSAVDGQIVASPEQLYDHYKEEYHKNYGIELNDELEIVAIRAEVRCKLPRRKQHNSSSMNATCLNGKTLKAYSFAQKAWLDFSVFHRDQLEPGAPVNGPAIILEHTTTTYVDADFWISVDNNGLLKLQREEPRQ